MSRRKIKLKKKKFSDLEKKIMKLALEGKTFAEVQEILGTELPETLNAMVNIFNKLPKNI